MLCVNHCSPFSLDKYFSFAGAAQPGVQARPALKRVSPSISRYMQLDEVISKLRARNEPVPRPMRLPTAAEVAAVEEELGIKFPDDYRKFLLEASDIVLGTLEPATVTNPDFHTHLPEVVESAREYGVPQTMLPICEDNGDFYCLDSSGIVRFWSHNGVANESWQNLAHWLQEVWLGEHT